MPMPQCCNRRVINLWERYCMNCGATIPKREPLKPSPLVAAMLEEECE